MRAHNSITLRSCEGRFLRVQKQEEKKKRIDAESQEGPSFLPRRFLLITEGTAGAPRTQAGTQAGSEESYFGVALECRANNLTARKFKNIQRPLRMRRLAGRPLYAKLPERVKSDGTAASLQFSKQMRHKRLSNYSRNDLGCVPGGLDWMSARAQRTAGVAQRARRRAGLNEKRCSSDPLSQKGVFHSILIFFFLPIERLPTPLSVGDPTVK